jgi:hypothetical protein
MMSGSIYIMLANLCCLLRRKHRLRILFLPPSSLTICLPELTTANICQAGKDSLTRNRGRLLENGFRALPLRVEKRGDSQFMKQNERH